MPFATRQGVIDFPKKKLLVTSSKSQKVTQNENKTPVLKSSVESVSSSARKALHSSNNIVGRTEELEKLTNFLKTHLKNQNSGSLYISGLPGTGKTASINYIIEKNALNKQYHIIKINCTAFNSSKAVFKRICEELSSKKQAKTEKDAISFIEKYLLKKHKMIIVVPRSMIICDLASRKLNTHCQNLNTGFLFPFFFVGLHVTTQYTARLLILDEIDQLESKCQSVLYKIFEWPSWENAKFVLVGIANAMDLTDRNLPRLCGKAALKPILLHFPPYTKDEIAKILKQRLIEVGAEKMFAPGSIELISAKVAGTSGDIRRALDLSRRVIEVAEQKNQGEKYCAEKENTEMKSISSSSKKLDNTKGLVNNIVNLKSPPKRRLNFYEGTPTKNFINSLEASPQKIYKGKNSERLCLSEIGDTTENIVLRSSPRKFSLAEINKEGSNCSPKAIKSIQSKYSIEIKTPTKVIREETVVRRSPRKLQFDVESKDVLSVVKTVFESSKNFKPSEESSFPLHQKLLICSLLLMIKKGKKKDLTVGKLHLVYSKVCTKRGLTAVDKSGFIFLCRQVEVTGIIQIGKGQGTLAKVTLQWDESEVTNSLKDLNLLSSILNDVSCLG